MTTLLERLFPKLVSGRVAELPWTEDFINADLIPPMVVKTDIEKLKRFNDYTVDFSERKRLLEGVVLFLLEERDVPPVGESRSFYLRDGVMTMIVQDGLFQVFVIPRGAELIGAQRYTTLMGSTADQLRARFTELFPGLLVFSERSQAWPWNQRAIMQHELPDFIAGVTAKNVSEFLPQHVEHQVGRLVAVNTVVEYIVANSVPTKQIPFVFNLGDGLLAAYAEDGQLNVYLACGETSDVKFFHYWVPINFGNPVEVPEQGVKIQQSSISGAHRLPQVDQPPFRMADLVRHTGPRTEEVYRQFEAGESREELVFPWHIATRVLQPTLEKMLMRHTQMSQQDARNYVASHLDKPDEQGLIRKYAEKVLKDGAPLYVNRGLW